MLLFRSEETVEKWCAENSMPKRPLIDMNQLWQLAVQWYANRITVDSRRPAPGEIVGIFSAIGLDEPFWDPQADQWKPSAD
jgi:hypothetical protein